ncbi:MAG: amidohydrolase [Actinobacteria bacterium]|nr:amidohydrolase [Actinomycetota bacterium]
MSVRLETSVINAAANELAPAVAGHRRAIHRHPELGFGEHRTAAYIESVLTRLGLSHRRVVGTGVVAVLEGRGPGCVGVRADMDALPVPEAPGRAGYRSEIEGLSHACGHDGHVAVLLGLAELLAATHDLPGSVALYFQPAEEGPGGAAPMVEAGVLDDPVPDAIIALHVSSAHPAGVVALRGGPATGSDDTVRITVHGMGGHAAHPDTALDPVPVAAQIVTTLQHVVTREFDPAHPVVLSFGTIHGGTRHNIIAPSVELTGTFRTVHARNRALLARRIPEVARAVAAAHRATVTVDCDRGYAPGFNDPAVTDVVASSARSLVGRERVVSQPDPSLGAEDFYAFGQTGVPVSMFRLGVANPGRGIVAPHHSPDFDIDESGLPVGVAVLAESIRRLLDGR